MKSNHEYNYFGTVLEYEYDWTNVLEYEYSYSESMSTEYDYSISGVELPHIDAINSDRPIIKKIGKISVGGEGDL